MDVRLTSLRRYVSAGYVTLPRSSSEGEIWYVNCYRLLNTYSGTGSLERPTLVQGSIVDRSGDRRQMIDAFYRLLTDISE